VSSRGLSFFQVLVSLRALTKSNKTSTTTISSPTTYCMTLTETTYVTPSAPVEDNDIPIVGAVPVHDEPRQQKTGTVARTNTATTRPSTTTTTVTHVPPPSHNTSYPPPGVADGGTWGTIKHSGGNTWGLCAAISIVGCMVTLFPCGVFAFCCPCDEKDAYVINRKVYNHNGQYLGPVSRFDFRRHYR